MQVMPPPRTRSSIAARAFFVAAWGQTVLNSASTDSIKEIIMLCDEERPVFLLDEGPHKIVS